MEQEDLVSERSTTENPQSLRSTVRFSLDLMDPSGTHPQAERQGRLRLIQSVVCSFTFSEVLISGLWSIKTTCDRLKDQVSSLIVLVYHPKKKSGGLIPCKQYIAITDHVSSFLAPTPCWYVGTLSTQYVFFSC